jgi:hypothetical protein
MERPQLAELARYRKAGVLLADVPRIDFSGQRSAAEVSGQLAKSLDRMSQWAFGEAAEQAKAEGLQYGAENPVTQQQLLDAVTAGENPDKLFQKKNTVFGDAARVAQVAALTSEIEMTAQQRMNMLKLGVERGEVDLPQAQSEIQALLDGFGKSLVQVDPRASLKLRASLATNANAAYLSMSQSYFKRVDEQKKQAVDQWIDVTLGEQVRTIIEAGDTVDPTNGGKITVQQRIDATVRQTLLNQINTISDPVFARQAMTRYSKIVSDARVDALTKVASSPEFARDPRTGKFDPVAAVARADTGDFGAYSSVFKAMPADEQLRVRTGLRQASADRWTAEQRAEAQVKQTETLEVNELVSQFPTANGEVSRKILTRLREISTSSGAISGSAINALVKSRKDGDGEGTGNMAVQLEAENFVRRGGATSIDQVMRRYPGLKAKQVARLSDMILDDGEKRLNKEINLQAGIPDGVVQMTGDQQRRKLALEREAARLKREQIDKGGRWDPDVLIADLSKRRAEITAEREEKAALDRLATLGQQRKANLTAQTSLAEMQRLGYKPAEITEIQRQQKIINGQ